MKYARETEVPAAKSQAEIAALLKKAGADPVGIMDGARAAFVQFEMRGRRIQFRIDFPGREELRLRRDGRRRDAAQLRGAAEKEIRRRWRALLLAIKAKLVSIEDGVETFDEAFLPHVVMPDGRTLSERIVPDLDRVLETNALPPLLPGPSQ